METLQITRDELAELLDPLRVMAKEAGERIMDVYKRGFHIETKTDDSPVTEADMGAHEVIVNGLQNLPHVLPVLSEESVDIPYSARQQWDTYWLVDPLDGTREFINRNGEFTVNIALIHGNESILGVIYVPVYDLFYYAAKDMGAFKYHENNPPQKIHCRPRGENHVVAADNHIVLWVASMQGKAAGSLFNLCLDQPGWEKYALAVDFGASFFKHLQSRRIAKIHSDFSQNLQ